MALTNGTRLGPYEIQSALGAGGMGEVYRGRDTRLDRTVAIKVLPAHLAGDAQFRERFDREAHAIAALTHPHICALYDVGEAPSPQPLAPSLQPPEMIRFLVMEYLEGETLAARLAKGALPLDQVLRFAIEIADALDKAHRAGIVHRDLKPGNVMLTKGGAKLLDFGLAKSGAPVVAGAGLSMLPTTPPHLTAQGTILGTFQYMAPEQLEGQDADARTDLFAFGAVVYEMATGKKAFEGKSQASLIAAILEHAPPPIAASQPLTPPALDRVVRKCLAKVPDDRWQSAKDLCDELKWISEGAAASTTITAGGAHLARSRRRELAWATLLGAALMAVGGAGVVLSGVWPRPGSSATRPLRLSIVHPEGKDVGVPAISPDGTHVAYGARRNDGIPLLWVRDLASGDARALPGTEDAALPFWSPDSHDLGFYAGGSLKRVPADGGPIQVITDKLSPQGAAWATDGTIVFGAAHRELFKVPATGGTVTPATKLPSPDWSHYWPSFLPDNRRFLFTAKQWSRAAETSEQGIYLGSLDSTESRRLLPDLSSAVYAPPGSLVFVRDGTLSAAPFDLAGGRITGPAASIGGSVAVDGILYFSWLSAAADGTLAVRPPPAVAPWGSFDAELRLVDRTGAAVGMATLQPYTGYLRLNRDGRRAVTGIVDPRTSINNLWLVDLQSGDRTPLTTTPGSAGQPVWSPDGTRLAYAYQPPGEVDDVYIKDLRNGQATPIIESPAGSEHPIAWSHDGRYLLVDKIDEKGDRDLWAWSFESRTLTRFGGSRVLEAAFSPDDRYVAFSTEESGRAEVSVTTFPKRDQTWSLTTDGGRIVSWRADGREILVANLAGHIVAYPVSTEDAFAAGQPTIIVRDIGVMARYGTATPDHSKILIRVSPDAAKDKGEIQLLFGWADAWRQGTPITRP